MALINCPECGKEISDTVKTCIHCGYRLKKKKQKKEKPQKEPSKNRKKIIDTTILVLVLLISVGAYLYFFSPKTVPWLCKHNTTAATCEKPETCIRCGKNFGKAKGHDWKKATCIKPQTCKVCGKEIYAAKGHKWIEASCENPKFCKVCGLTEGEALGHDVKNYMCTRCNKSFATKRDVPNILDIASFTYKTDYNGGIDVYLTFVNKSEKKTINYITVDMDFKNAVGDALTDSVSGDTIASLVFTGPLKPGETSIETYWRDCFYNSTYAGSNAIKKIKIDYSDGTTLVLDEDVAWYAIKPWR